MRRARPLVAALVLSGLVGCASGGPAAGPGMLVYVAWDGRPLPRLVVADGSGATQREIELPDLPSGGPVAALDSRDLALVTTSDAVLLVSAGQGTIRTLALPDDAVGDVLLDRTGSFEVGQDRVMLTDVRREQAFLVDLGTAAVVDLEQVTGGSDFFFSSRFSPSESHLLLQTDEGLWLVPAADPSGARRIGESERVQGAGFADEGASIVYAQLVEADTAVVRVERVDGSRVDSIRSVAALDYLGVLLRHEEVLVKERDVPPYLVSLEDGSETSLPDVPGDDHRFVPSPDGSRALVRSEAEGEDDFLWHLLDLDRSTVAELSELRGAGFPVGIGGTRWLIMATRAPRDPGSEPAVFVGFDFETGQARRMLELPEDVAYIAPPSVTPDGRHAVVGVAQPDRTGQVWYMDAQEGTSHKLGGDVLLGTESATSVISADGRWAAAVVRGEGSPPALQVALLSTQGDQVVTAGNGIYPVWVRP